MKIETKRERLYSGPMHHGPRFHYVAYFSDQSIATVQDKVAVESAAIDVLLGAYQQQASSIYASVAADGSVFTTREYTTGCFQTAHHRADDGRGSGICMSRLEIGGKRVTAREYHAHYLALYNENCKPAEITTTQEVSQ